MALALTLGLGMAAQATIITVDSASTTAIGGSYLTAAQIIDGALSADIGSFPTVTALTEANKLTLVSNSKYQFLGQLSDGGTQFYSNNPDGETVTFNFTDATVGEVLIWTYSQKVQRCLEGISKVEVMTDGSTWVDQSLSMTLAEALTVGFKAQTLALSGAISGVDGIRLTMQKTDGDASGFDEVAFSSIPEPATLGMVALFGGGILFIRRKLMI